jgi:homoserine kinase
MVPASVGNVGPGFDVLGLAVDWLFDEITVARSAEGMSPWRYACPIGIAAANTSAQRQNSPSATQRFGAMPMSASETALRTVATNMNVVRRRNRRAK